MKVLLPWKSRKVCGVLAKVGKNTKIEMLEATIRNEREFRDNIAYGDRRYSVVFSFDGTRFTSVPASSNFVSFPYVSSR